MTVTPQSGLPSITAPATAKVSLGQSSPIGGISVAETPTTTGEMFTAVLTDASGVLSATTAGTGGGGRITPSNGGKTLTISGTLAQLNADLTTLTDTDADGGRYDHGQCQRQFRQRSYGEEHRGDYKR